MDRDTYSPCVKVTPHRTVGMPSLGTALAVIRMARKIDPSPAAVMQWYLKVPIEEFGGLVARQLVTRGEGEAVLSFLTSIHRGSRG